MILVTGATGNLGSAIIQSLLDKGYKSSDISVLVRDKAKAESLKAKGVTIKMGDYGDYNSLVDALTGVNILFFVSIFNLTEGQKMHYNLIRAAKDTGVKHVIYTSFERKNDTNMSPIVPISQLHLTTEQAIEQSGIPFTIVKNNLYMENIPLYIGENVLQTGIFFPGGKGRASYVARKELAEAIANMVITSGHENKVYHLNNIENYSFEDVVKALNQKAASGLTYSSPSEEIYKEALEKAGVPQEFIWLLSGFAKAIAQNEFDNTTTDLTTLLGRKPMNLQTFIDQTYVG